MNATMYTPVSSSFAQAYMLRRSLPTAESMSRDTSLGLAGILTMNFPPLEVKSTQSSVSRPDTSPAGTSNSRQVIAARMGRPPGVWVRNRSLGDLERVEEEVDVLTVHELVDAQGRHLVHPVPDQVDAGLAPALPRARHRD